MLNTEYIRSNFPALKGDWIFMDNAGGSQTLRTVADRINNYLLTTNVQLGASYQVSDTATRRVEEARKAVAQFVNAASDSEIILGSSTSMLIRILSICLSRTFLPGDEIIVTNCDHEANIGAWRDLEKIGMVIKEWKINPDSFRMETPDLISLLTDKTRLVALTHTSNILGTLNPVKEWSKIIHDMGALICVDGVAHAPHRLVDVQDLDVDFYAFSFYKVYGPHMAMMYGKKELLLNMPGINHFFIGENEIPYKFQPGSVNYELSFGLLGLMDYINTVAEKHNINSDNFRVRAASVFDLFAQHEEEIVNPLIEFLNSKNKVKIVGEKGFEKEVRVPTVSFVTEGLKSDSVTLEVDKFNIGIRYGDFYARRLIDDLALSDKNGVVRISMVHYNTLEEVKKIISVLDRII